VRVEPSVKGSIVVGAVAALRKLRSQGRVSPEALSARLSGAALELLEQKIEAGRWYPVGPFCELLDLEWEIAGDRRPEHARESGARSADRLIASGSYQQLDYAERADRAASRDALRRQVHLVTSITGALYNFLRTQVTVDEANGCLEVVYTNAAAFSEPLRLSTEGFMNQLNVRQGSARRWTSERRSPSEIVFRLALPGRLSR
jgi:hypothetical protein